MLIILLLGVPALVLMNGFFVAAEYALVRSRLDRIQALTKEGARGAALAQKQIEKIDEYIATSQVGITLASIGIGAVGEPAIAELLKKPLGGVLGHAFATALAVAIGYTILTVLHITLGELVPKIYTVGHAEGVARRLARPLEFFTVLFRPFSRILSALAGVILRPFGVRPEGLGEETTTSEDLKFLIARSVSGGTLDPGEAVMLSGVFHLHEQQARNVMTPLPAVVTVDVSEDVETALQRCIDSGHTRLLVTEDENTDRVRGVVHNNSLARLLMTRGAQASIEPAVKDAVLVPETRPLDDLLADIQRERVSMAVVIDEYGRTSGIVTVEDIIEEIVGEIADETDPAAGAVRRLANGDLYVRGHVAINDLADYGMELDVDSDAYNSVGGLVFGELGRLPKRGDMVQVGDYSLRVESVRENRIEAVRIRDHSRERAAARDAEPDEGPDSSS
ncbi:MAG: magnesium and cobalt exporter, family [Thermoleophilaceae bacterium]|nr:magnesium and cobalt exporter, family [Thermoleophilaceae bacterium]